MRHLPILALSITLLLNASCSSGGERILPPEEETPSSADGSSPGFEPEPVEPGSPAGPPGVLGFDLPDGWRQTPPSSSMRLAQAEIPGPGGPAELAVFFFGPGQGGGVEANLDRWIGQMEITPGTEPRRERFDVGELTVTWVEVEGTFKGGTMGGPASAQPGWTLLAAVVEGPGGPWFFKATGPKQTLAAARDDFLQMLRSVRLSKPA